MGERVKLDVKYELGHSYPEEWEATVLFCPSCGTRAVWVRCGDGDYYQGSSYLCAECGARAHLDGVGPTTTNWQDRQRLVSIRTAQPSLPPSPPEEPRT